jgi:hypothetical protein
MRIHVICFFLLLISFNSIFSQKKSLEIISSNNLDSKDLIKLKELVTFFNEKKINLKFNLKYKNYLNENEDYFDLETTESVDEIDTNYTNGDFEKIESFKASFEKEFTDKFSYQYIKPNLKKGKLSLNINDNKSSDLIEIEKWVKKNKNSKNDIFIIWNNGYQPYKYSPEYISKIIEQLKLVNKSKQIIPKITKPDTSVTNVLRPDESHYKIEFDSVGLFPKYQIQISKKFKNGDSIIILNECLDFISSKEFNENKRQTKFALYSKNSKKCVFAISEKELGLLCIQYDESGKVENVDLECDCQFDCLYHNRFSLTIKGCVDGLNEADIPTAFIKKVMFQCNASN